MGIKRRTEEEIVEILREAEKSELSVAEICRIHAIPDNVLVRPGLGVSFGEGPRFVIDELAKRFW